ncbi:sensor histidine kinase [Pedosphaera parvula]|uniref:histidine kinase n=1 Tax=Pedosphaera parvula (strain Ellin514) TaxID=320771 RepID=B9XNB7_PEDPL|nr:sensor histidine kinase [Pedosphaera parvula]EEF58670.1 multi-sensor signal transduction histidine kinase [Pedosphaera parvula Ellin514]
MSSPFNKFVAGSFTLALVIFASIGVVTFRTTNNLIHTTERVAHTREVLETLGSLLSELDEAEVGERGYVITGNQELLEPYHSALRQIKHEASRLRTLTQDNLQQQGRMDKMDPLINSKLTNIEQIIKIRSSQGFELAAAAVAAEEGRQVMDKIRSLVTEMKSEEAHLLKGRTEISHTDATTALEFSRAGTITGFVLLLLSFYFLRYEIKRRELARQEVTNLNEYLKSRTAKLESANEELEAFSYSVSHDLRAPIRHISGFVDLLSKQASVSQDAKNARYLKFINNAVHHMGALVDDLLSYSNMSGAELRIETVDLGRSLREVKDSLSDSYAKRSIVWCIDENFPTVQADSSMIRLVFVKLLSNAIKYTRPRSEAHITIQYSSTRSEHLIEIKDNGVGFDMQYVNKLFGVFQKLHHPDEFEGTGIGLATVKRIISRHGGRTWAEGTLDKGAMFSFSIPKDQISKAAGSE